MKIEVFWPVMPGAIVATEDSEDSSFLACDAMQHCSYRI
jgi:hypothetical protein